MRNAVQFGAGNIGRGFLGQLLFEGGYRTTFVDANPVLVSGLNVRRSYPLRLVTDSSTETLTVRRLCALEAGDQSAIVDALCRADLVSTAVGVGVLPRVAPLLTAGLSARALAGGGPLDILLCENQWHAAPMMRSLLEPHIAPDAREYFATQVGLVETVIGRMVPAPTEALRAEDPLLVVAEPYKELPVANSMLRGPGPALPGLILADNFEAYEARKLYLHNMGHAALAYLGYLRGCEFIWQCACDETIAPLCRAALAGTAIAISARYGLALEGLQEFNRDLMRRFTNRALGDTVARVAADPLRKLRPTDRLSGAAALIVEQKLDPRLLAGIIAAALRYDNPADASAGELQQRRRAEGDRAVLSSLCGIAPDSALGALVLRALTREGTGG